MVGLWENCCVAKCFLVFIECLVWLEMGPFPILISSKVSFDGAWGIQQLM